MIPTEWLNLADFLAKLGQFFFGFCTLSLGVWAAVFKRRDLFRTELSKRQLDELGQIRTALQSLFFDLYYIPMTADTMRTMGWNIDVLKENDPESWEQYERYKRTSLDLYYKFSDANYYLVPDWVDEKRRTQFAECMTAFAPFTLHSTTSRTTEERHAYAKEIASMKEYLDVCLRKHA